jgi:hypothetical protein
MRVLGGGAALLLAHLVGCSGAKTGDGDRDGSTGTDADGRPDVTLLSPLSRDRLYEAHKIAFSGIVMDDVDAPNEIEAFWSSDVQGRIDVEARPGALGAFTGYGYLDLGDHALTLTAVDTEGNVATTTEVVSVGPPNTAPSCEIVVPGDGDGGAPGDVLALTALVSDPDIPADELDVWWTSDLDGAIGSPRPSTDGIVVLTVTDLSIGYHRLSLEVSDDAGATCVDQVNYTVGSVPEVQIDEPADGSSVGEGSTLRLSGTVSDPSDAISELTVSWRSDVEGELWTGTAGIDGSVSVSVTDLTVGMHGITLSAVDPAGLAGFQTVYVLVDGQPSQPEVAIAPRPATSADDLTAVITLPSADPEGAEIVYVYSWFQDGLPYTGSTSTTVSADATGRGEEWRVVVTPNDGVGEGESADAVVTIQNTPPEIAEVQLTPDPPATQDDLHCTPIGAMDVDGDAVAVTTGWTIDGAAISETSATLSSSWTEKGAMVTCTATPTDGLEAGTAVVSNTVFVGNTPPSIDRVLITPDALFSGDTPTCTYIGYSDADADADASTLTWSINGSVVSTSERLTEPFIRYDTVTCTVTPSDGETMGAPMSETIIVSNSAPSMLVAEMLPWPAFAGDTLRCTGWGYSDPDGDDDDSYVAWSVDGGIVGIGGSLSGLFVGGNIVTCAITPFDGTDEGATVSMTQEIANTAPTLSGVEITPLDPDPGDTLSCATTGYSDIDGDEEASRMIWLVNDFEVSGETDWVLDGGFGSGDTVACLVTVSDGMSDGMVYRETITVGNAPPRITSLRVEPSPLTTDVVAVATVSSEDEDGDTVALNYTWSVNGDVVPVAGHTLAGTSYFDRGDTVTLTVVPFDGLTTGEAVTEGPLTVENTPPSAPFVVIAPDDPVEGVDALVCRVDAEGTDADGDPVSHAVVWSLDDVVYTETETTDRDGDTVPAGVPAGNEDWVCTVETDDGYAAGASGSASVVIAPTLGRTSDEPAESCRHLQESWSTAMDGAYWIDPAGGMAFLAWCDMSTDGGGWTRVAYAPSNRGAPEDFGTPTEVNPTACVDRSDFCMLDLHVINAMLYRGSDTDDRFRLVAADLPIHSRYFWDTDEDFDPNLTDPDSTWWAVSLSFGGEHSTGCMPSDALGLGHDPSADCSIDAASSHRVFWMMADGEVTGAASDSTFAWYAR